MVFLFLGKVNAYLDNSLLPTIRTSNCQLLLPTNINTRCNNCKAYRKTLHALIFRTTKKKSPTLTPHKEKQLDVPTLEVTDEIHSNLINITQPEPDIMNIKNWCKLIDRGGLHHCTKEFKMTLFSFEKTVKENTLITQDKIPLEIIKHKLKLSTTSTSYWNECFNMNTLTEAKEHLLELIINEYVNLRGFAFAARWMEKYKYNNKRNVVKSKGLRNKLQHEE